VMIILLKIVAVIAAVIELCPVDGGGSGSLQSLTAYLKVRI